MLQLILQLQQNVSQSLLVRACVYACKPLWDFDLPGRKGYKIKTSVTVTRLRLRLRLRHLYGKRRGVKNFH